MTPDVYFLNRFGLNQSSQVIFTSFFRSENAIVLSDHKIIRRAEVLRLVPISVSGLYEKISDNGFSKQIRLGPRTVGWRKQEVLNWLVSQNA